MVLITNRFSHIQLDFCFSFFPLCQGIKARILETFVMLFLLALLILGIVWVASALIDNDPACMESLYGTFKNHSVSVLLVNVLMWGNWRFPFWWTVR